MIRTIILLAVAMLYTTPTPKPHVRQDALAITLEPDYSTLWLDASGPREFNPCNPWPIQPYRPRAFNLRGKIFDGAQNEIGSYYARGVIRQSDGAHVADYALTIKGVGLVTFGLDALPDVAAAELDGFVIGGLLRASPYLLTIKPRRVLDCTWGMRWEAVLQLN